MKSASAKKSSAIQGAVESRPVPLTGYHLCVCHLHYQPCGVTARLCEAHHSQNRLYGALVSRQLPDTCLCVAASFCPP